jgi:hypothetical protein
MDDFNLENLTKEIVLERFKNVSDAPAVAGEIARQIVAKAVTGTSQPPRESVIATCRGLMSGMLLLEKDLAVTAVAILNQMDAVAQESHQDPAELMTWAMEGIAPVAKLAGRDACAAVENAIEASFMGAGQVFAKSCATAGA